MSTKARSGLSDAPTIPLALALTLTLTSHGMGPTASIRAVLNDNPSWCNNSYVAPTSSC